MGVSKIRDVLFGGNVANTVNTGIMTIEIIFEVMLTHLVENLLGETLDPRSHPGRNHR